jgi:hypothetical protein
MTALHYELHLYWFVKYFIETPGIYTKESMA